MMKRTHYHCVLIVLVAVVALGTALPGAADDRMLLMSRGAPPNVLMVVDSSGSMAQDVDYDKRNFVAGGDDPHAKMSQVKYAVKYFVDHFPGFNMGFTFYERNSVQFGDHLFLYRLDPGETDTFDFSWRFRREPGAAWNNSGSQKRMQLAAGDPLRLGDWTAMSGTYQYQERWGPLGGATGKALFSDWSNGTSSYPRVYFQGARNGKYRVDAWLVEPTAGTGYYYPSYTFSEDSDAVPNAIDAYYAVQDQYAAAIYDPLATPETKVAALAAVAEARRTLQNELDAHQIGSRELTLRVTLFKCNGTVSVVDNKGRPTGTCSTGWVTVSTVDYRLLSAGGLRAADFDPADTGTPGEYPPHFMVNEYGRDTNKTATAHFYTAKGSAGQYYSGAQDFYTNNDCNGWLGATPDETKIPIIPIPTDDDPPLIGLMELLLNPMPQMQLHFPTRASGLKYWPRYWDPSPPCQFDNQATCSFDYRGVMLTDRSMYNTGATPIGNCINDTAEYFLQDVLDRVDPLKFCRKNFMILLTDGLETCKSNPCVAATNLYKNTYNQTNGTGAVSIFVIGYGLGIQGSALQCIADNSHGELYLPNSIEELIDALMHIGQQIEERSRGFASPTVPSVELSTREKGYISTFIPRNHRSIWEGHLRAYEVLPETGMIPTTCSDAGGTILCYPDTTKALWDAGEVLRTTLPSDRNIYFGTAGGSVPGARFDFTVSSATSATLKARIDPTLTDEQLSQVVAFMRGDRDTTIYDNPPYKLGDIFHSVPSLSAAPDCYSCYLQDAEDYREGFYLPNQKRRKLLLVGADDGMFHAFDAGFWGRDTAHYPDAYDNGNGKELWAFVPNAVMGKFDELAFGEEHRYTVDGTPTVSDVFIDPAHSGVPDLGQRQWRTVVLFGGRNGSDSFVCLDVTQPDGYGADGVPISGSGDMPGCLSGGTGCSGNYPALLWEFADRADSDGNGYQDMAETWSRPVVGWIRVKPVDKPVETRNVAIVGGGYHPDLLGGNFLYIIDIETGKVLLKTPANSSVPCEVGALDFNFDSYIERLYWGDTTGGLWRLDTAKVAELDATGKIIFTSNGWQAPTRLLSVGADQRFFQRPLIMLAGFTNTGAPLFAVGMGAGDREKIFDRDSTIINRFYMVIDREDGVTLSEANLQAITTSAPAVATGTNYLLDNTLRGWYLVLGEFEKVNTPAIAVNNNVIFSTFTPGEGIEITPDPANPGSYLCRESGNAKTYVVDYTNANPYAAERALQLPGAVAMASEPIVYVGEDGKLHVLQATDNLAMVEPVAPRRVGATVVSWRER